MLHPKILVPVDFSELSEHALKAANIIARLFEGRVTPYHAYIPVTDLDGFYYVGSGITPHEKYTEIEKVLGERLQEVASKNIHPEYLSPPLLDVGNPARAIIHASNEFDLVIMSTQGRTGFSRFVMGSVTDKVLRMCKKPVITVSEKSNLGSLSSLLVTTDFSENSYQVFPFAARIAKGTGARVELVHIVSSEQFFDSGAMTKTVGGRQKEIEKLADIHFKEIREQVDARIITGQRTPYLEIEQLAGDRGYDLIFLSSVGRTGLDYLMMGSTASHVVRRVKNAVFTINPHGISPEKAKTLHYQYRDQ